MKSGQRLKALVQTISLLSIFIYCQPAKSMSMIKTAAMVQIDKGIEHNWSCSNELSPGKYTDISLTIYDDWDFKDPKIARSSGDAQYDVECLETVCGLSPIYSKFWPKPETLTHSSRDYWVRFGQLAPNSDQGACRSEEHLLHPQYDGKDVREYLKNRAAQPASSGTAAVVIHKIPIVVLKRLRGVFTEAEILNKDNLVEIKLNENDSKEAVPAYV